MTARLAAAAGFEAESVRFRVHRLRFSLKRLTPLLVWIDTASRAGGLFCATALRGGGQGPRVLRLLEPADRRSRPGCAVPSLPVKRSFQRGTAAVVELSFRFIFSLA
jgi:hypothetical protein